MNFKELKQEIKNTYLKEYADKVREETFFKFTFDTAKAFSIGALSVTCAGFIVGGAFAGGEYASVANAAINTAAGGMVGTAVFSVSAAGIYKVAEYIAKRQINKDIKNGKLLERYKNEIIPQKKKALRAEASAEVKAFDAKKEARKEAFNALDEIATLPADDFKKAFNNASFKQKLKNVYYKTISVTPLKSKGPKS